jgi:hypothetical protein
VEASNHESLATVSACSYDPTHVREGMNQEMATSVETVLPRIAFFSDNGHGLGHLTRLMAIAKRLPSDQRAIFITLSESHEMVDQLGFPVEYFPSAKKFRIPRDLWDHLFYARIVDFVTEFRPTVLVIDHVTPPPLLLDLRQTFPELRLVWSRRGSWKAGRNAHVVALASGFDLIIEPLDIASPFDRGATTWQRVAHVTPPITLLDAAELLPRDDARRGLGLAEEGPACLLQLSADTADDLRTLISRARDMLLSKGEIQIFAPLHPLYSAELGDIEGVHTAPIYPVSRYARAFDAAVSTAGYNSVHELIMAGIPTLFVARDTPGLDDQARRAWVASAAGAAEQAPSLTSPAAEVALELILHPALQPGYRAACEALYPGNGAQDAADLVATLADGGGSRSPVDEASRE